MKNYDLQLYADDMCILYSHPNVKFIERNLNYYAKILTTFVNGS